MSPTIALCCSHQGATGVQSDHIISLLNLAERLPLPSWERPNSLAEGPPGTAHAHFSHLSLLLTFHSSLALLDSSGCARLSHTTGLSACCSSCTNTFPPPPTSLS